MSHSWCVVCSLSINVSRTLILGLPRKQNGYPVGYITLVSIIYLLKRGVQCLGRLTFSYGLLTMAMLVGPLICSLVAPKKVTECSYSAIVENVKVHHSPRPFAIVQCFKFSMRQRQKGESVSDYVAALWKLTEFCKLGETLDDMLRNRLVCGINDGRILHRLLAECKLTFEKALEIAQAMEFADRDAKDLQVSSNSPHECVHKVFHGTQKESKSPQNNKGQHTRSNCCRCGGKHSPTICKFKLEKCHAWGKLGHVAKLCRAKMSSSKPYTSKRQDLPKTEQTLNMQEYIGPYATPRLGGGVLLP